VPGGQAFNHSQFQKDALMIRNTKKVLTAALALVSLSLSTLSSAGTSNWVYEGNVTLSTTGGELSCHVYSISTYCLECEGNDTVGHYCQLKDTRADGDGVYMTYQIDGYRGRRINFYHDNSTSVWFWRAQRGDDPVSRLNLKLCRDRGNLTTDNCSSNEVRIYPN